MRTWWVRIALCSLLVYLIFSATNHTVDGRNSSHTVGNQRFGIIESYESPTQATALGVGWTRVVFHWAEIQSSGDSSWTPKVPEEQLQAEIDAGREVVGLLIGIPAWARDENNLPRGLWLPYDDRENTWANYVRMVVTHWSGRIDHWIIWNEPDIRDTEIAHTWDGSVADFAQLQRVAYLVVKEANPQAIVHLAAFTYWADQTTGTVQYMARLLDEIQKDPDASSNNHYFDVATAHLYFQPAQIYDLLTVFIRIMNQRGLKQPIWLVETNAPPNDDPIWPVADWFLSVTLEEQAAFIPQAIASALAAGAQRVAVYKLKDTEEDRQANPEPFGLLRLDGSRRPAFSTYQVAINHLAGVTGVYRERWDNVGQIRLARAGGMITMLFSRQEGGVQVQVQANSSIASLVDMWGHEEVVYAENGKYSVDLPGAECSQRIGAYCMIGGPTYYLVQTDATPTPTETASPERASIPTMTNTRTPTSTATETEIPTPTATRNASETPTWASTTIQPESATLAPAETKTSTITPQGTAGQASSISISTTPFPTEVIGEPDQATGLQANPIRDVSQSDSPASVISIAFIFGGLLFTMLILVWLARKRLRR